MAEIQKWIKELFINPDKRIIGLGDSKMFPLYWYQIFPTYRCTRKCGFCFVDKQKGNLRNVPDMNEKTLQRLCEWLPKSYYEHNYLFCMVQFLGGEPLLLTPYIKRIMDAVFEKTPGMIGLLHTNADLWDSVNWDDLDNINIWHLQSGNTDIDELSRRLDIILSHGENLFNGVPSCIAIVWDEYNLSRMEELISFARDRNIALRTYHDYTRSEDEPYKEHLLKRMHDAVDLLEKYKMTSNLFLDAFVKWDYPVSQFPCGSRLITIQPDGSAGVCTREPNLENSRIGTIFDEGLLAKVKTRKDWHVRYNKIGHPEECLTCIVKNTCQGGCIFDRVHRTKKLTGSYAFCKLHKEIFPRLNMLQ